MDNYLEQGLNYLDYGDYDNALAMLTKAVRLSLGNMNEILTYRGRVYALLGDFVRAIADFDSALEFNVYASETYNERGLVYLAQERYKEALQDFNFALTTDAQFTEARLNRALVYEAMGLYDECVLDLSLVIQQNPTISQAYEVRGRVYAVQKRYSEAIADLERYLRMGGGREHDNHSETQSFIIILRAQRLLARVLRWRS